jgi:hypothetical protein
MPKLKFSKVNSGSEEFIEHINEMEEIKVYKVQGRQQYKKLHSLMGN